MTPRDAFVERLESDRVWVVARAFDEPLAALGWPSRDAVEAAVAAAGSRGRGATAILEVPGRSERLHLRPIQHGGLLGPLWRERIWGTRRPREELRVTEALANAGAPVPRAVLVVAFREWGPLWTAVYGSVHEEGSRDGLAFLDAQPDRVHLRRAARAVGRAIRRFHDAGGWHPDLHIKNLLFRETPETTEVVVIDLDGAQAGDPPDSARRMRELMRLYRSLVKRERLAVVGVRSCIAAFAAYCGGDRRLRSALLARLPSELRRVARHAKGYRTPSHPEPSAQV